MEKEQLSILSRLFSSTVIREMAREGRSPLFSRLINQSAHLNFDKELRVRDIFDAAFSQLKRRGQRNEYVYRAAITHNILLGRHSLKTSGLLSEFRIGNSKADTIIINGKATLYEIKSERDSLSRLSNQIDNYLKAFPDIFLVACESHIQSIEDNVPKHVGIMVLSQRNQLRTVRSSVSEYSSLCSQTIFESLRLNEAMEVFRRLGRRIPDVKKSEMYRTIRNEISIVPAIDVQSTMIKVLRQSRNLKSQQYFLDELPRSLQPAALKMDLSKSDRLNIAKALETPVLSTTLWC